MNMIFDIPCPKCNKICWVNNGDVDDLTVPDVEAVECPHCEHKWLLDDDTCLSITGTTLENANIERGGKTPNDVM